MSEFHLTILGCGSALPVEGRGPSAQYLRLGKHRILIDCGEGTQLRLREHHIKIQSITHICISHMHGDHYLGLMGLLFSMTLLGRTKPIQLIGPPQLKELIDMHLGHARAGLKFELVYHFTQAGDIQQILDLPSFTLTTLPLDHKIATTGFIFKEKPRVRKLIGSKLEYYKVPLKERAKIAQGADYINAEGETIANAILSSDPLPPKAYAYCSDTAYSASVCAAVKGVDVLYHESTFEQEDVERAHKTRHSTAAEAAQVALEAGVSKLLLGHYSARYPKLDRLLAEAQAVFPDCMLSFQGMQLDIHSLLTD